MYDGNTATASIQYSYLPSWISFLSQHAWAEQGRLGAVRHHLPLLVTASPRHPRLVITG